jgi:hypothetical protein
MAIIALVGVVVAIGASTAWHVGERRHVADMLDISELPSSARNIDCASFGVTDVLERCSLELEARHFAGLLAGHRYESVSETKMAYQLCCGPEVGEDFRVARLYLSTPSDAPYGGSLTVAVDAARRRVMVDLYIE